MNSYLVTPSSEAESQLLASLFKKMRVKTALVPNGNGNAPTVTTRQALKKTATREPVVARNQTEANILAAVAELNEILAGRREEGPDADALIAELRGLQN